MLRGGSCCGVKAHDYDVGVNPPENEQKRRNTPTIAATVDYGLIDLASEPGGSRIVSPETILLSAD
jgi:hypothetical protein